MPEVIRLEDTSDLIPTSKYKYGSWDFDTFNPVQSRLMETYDSDANIAIAAATSAGKTVCAEMYMAHEVRKRKGKAIYVGPLKALASEKEQDWTDKSHHFNDLDISIVTGDYRFTGQRIKELDDTDVIVMTPEMLASRCRNSSSDKSRFLYDVGTVVFDESHLLTVPSRGDHIEVALMKLVEINPNIRIVLLSATMPNVHEICGWTCKLTGRDTHFLESDYRPCPLNIHYETYYDGDRYYDQKEEEKVSTAINIVEYYTKDKFLVFVHTKRTGHLMVKMLANYGVKAEFHNADLNKDKRQKLEKKFKDDKDFRVIVATSTLAWGLNLPARRVIVTGLHRGLTQVENYDIQQMVGRAGRPRFDPVGDAYILVPESEKNEQIAKLRVKSPIKSTLLDWVGKPNSFVEDRHYKTLAFHVVSEVHRGYIKTKEQFHVWYRKSLAHYQDHEFDDSVVDRVLKMLEQYRAIKIEDGEYKCTALGTIASMFYYSPFDVSDLKRNFHKLFESGRQGDDFAVAMAMGNVDSFRWNIANKGEKLEMDRFRAKIEQMYGKEAFTLGAIKMGFAHLLMLQGKFNIPAFAAIQGGLKVDLERTMQVINAIDGMASGWKKKEWFKVLKMRLQYGVPEDMVSLCQIPNVGHVRANRLKKKGIHKLEDFLAYSEGDLMKFMKCSKKLAEEALEGARLIELKESIDVD